MDKTSYYDASLVQCFKQHGMDIQTNTYYAFFCNVHLSGKVPITDELMNWVWKYVSLDRKRMKFRQLVRSLGVVNSHAVSAITVDEFEKLFTKMRSAKLFGVHHVFHITRCVLKAYWEEQKRQLEQQMLPESFRDVPVNATEPVRISSRMSLYATNNAKCFYLMRRKMPNWTSGNDQCVASGMREVKRWEAVPDAIDIRSQLKLWEQTYCVFRCLIKLKVVLETDVLVARINEIIKLH